MNMCVGQLKYCAQILFKEQERQTFLWPTDAHAEAAASGCRGGSDDRSESGHNTAFAGAHSWRTVKRNREWFSEICCSNRLQRASPARGKVLEQEKLMTRTLWKFVISLAGGGFEPQQCQVPKCPLPNFVGIAHGIHEEENADLSREFCDIHQHSEAGGQSA